MNSFRSLIWKEYREIRWLMMAAGLSLCFPLINFAVGSHYITTWIIVFSGFFAIVLAGKISSSDIDDRVMLFIRSRSINVSSMLFAKFIMGFVCLIILTIVPLFCEGCLLTFLDRWDQGIVSFQHFAFFNLFLLIFLYSFTLMLILWTRQLLASSFLSFIVMLFLYFAPLYLQSLWTINLYEISNYSLHVMNPPFIQSLFVDFSANTVLQVLICLMKIVYEHIGFFFFYIASTIACLAFTRWVLRQNICLTLNSKNLLWVMGSLFLAVFLTASTSLRSNLSATVFPEDLSNLGTATGLQEHGKSGIVQFRKDKDLKTDEVLFVPYRLEDEKMVFGDGYQITCNTSYGKYQMPFEWNEEANRIYVIMDHRFFKRPEDGSFRDKLEILTLDLSANQEDSVIHRLNLTENYPYLRKQVRLPKMCRIQNRIYINPSNDGAIAVLSIEDPDAPRLLEPIHAPSPVFENFGQNNVGTHSEEKLATINLLDIESATPEEKMRVFVNIVGNFFTHHYAFNNRWFIHFDWGNLQPVIHVYEIKEMSSERVILNFYSRYAIPPFEGYFQFCSLQKIDIQDDRLLLLQEQSLGNNVLTVFDISPKGKPKLLHRFTSKHDSPNTFISFSPNDLFLLGTKIQRIQY